MMHIHKLKKYYFINEFNQNHLISLNKNISFIWRNKDKETITDLEKNEENNQENNEENNDTEESAV